MHRGDRRLSLGEIVIGGLLLYSAVWSALYVVERVADFILSYMRLCQ